jgi:DNA-binding IclR family transcriptional regulator
MRSMDQRAAPPPVVGALMHGLAILDLFSADERVLGVADMARRLGVHKSSASRLAATLSAAGFLEPAGQTGRYRLGAKLVRLASLAADGAASLPQIAVPLLRPLVDEVGETGHVAVLDGTEVVTVGVVDGWRSVRMHSVVGKRSPAHATATGKVLLAGLADDEVRRRYADAEALEVRTPRTLRTVDTLLEALADVRSRGCAFDAEELETGLRCLAAPVLDHTGQVVAAVGLSGPAERFSPEARADLAGDLQRTAGSVSAALGAPPRVEGASPPSRRTVA